MALKNVKKTVGNVAGQVVGKAATAGGFVAGAAKAAAGKAGEAADLAAAAAKEHQEKTIQRRREARFKGLCPVTREEYFAEDFDLPHVIVVVDEDEVKEVPEFEGCIGRLGVEDDGLEVFHIHRDFIQDSGLEFHPAPDYRMVFSADPHNDRRFVGVEGIFQTYQQERITELRDIARDLGAKYCLIESSEVRSTKSRVAKKGGVTVKAIPGNGGTVDSASVQIQGSSSRRRVCCEVSFEGSSEPRPPQLRWYKGSREIQSLVDTVCGGANKMGSQRLTIQGSSSTTMSRDQATKIDALIKKLKLKASGSLEKKYEEESSQELIYYLEF